MKCKGFHQQRRFNTLKGTYTKQIITQVVLLILRAIKYLYKNNRQYTYASVIKCSWHIEIGKCQNSDDFAANLLCKKGPSLSGFLKISCYSSRKIIIFVVQPKQCVRRTALKYIYFQHKSISYRILIKKNKIKLSACCIEFTEESSLI